MSIPPSVVNTARKGWHWQWNQLMNGLAPADKDGNYLRPPSQHQKAVAPKEEELSKIVRSIINYADQEADMDDLFS